MANHICRAESAPDVWLNIHADSLIGEDCDCCPNPPARGKFSKVEPLPNLHVHRGHRNGPVLRSVQCDECGNTEFVQRCRQCGSLFADTINGPCPICSADGGPKNEDWEYVQP